MSVHEAIACAEPLLPGVPAPDDALDPRWQAIIAVGEYVETNPEEVLAFVIRWGGHEQWDLSAAIATCLLEDLFRYHFDLVFPRVARLALSDPLFADTLCQCWTLGQTPANARLLKQLRRRLGRWSGI